jgi:predicted nucleic acid-binding protein
MLLLDTNIVSFSFKADSRSQLYASWLQGQSLAIAFVTAAELYKWPLERGWGTEKRETLDRFVGSFAVLPYDDALARAWAQLMADCKRRGRVPDFADAWIAATAIRHTLVLVTHNPKDFAGIQGLTVWSKAPGHA